MPPTRRPRTIRAAGTSSSQRFVTAVMQWYEAHGRSLPWRHTRTPYRILLSEIMLQQTQVRRVLTKYPLFLRRFPSLASLARASQREVVLSWQGMGYNNRAVRLHRLARVVVRMNRGKIPDTYESLIVLPGIGNYTANALLSAVHGRDVPAVDVNVRRLLSRAFWRLESTRQMRPEAEIQKCAERLLPKGRGYDWNQALMDIGATICTARRPECLRCPVSSYCKSRRSMSRIELAGRKAEPSLDGVPNRVYRGMIIEQLRLAGGRKSVRLDRLAKKIHPGFSRRHRAWLNGILNDLRKDELITVKGNGSLKTRRVALA